MPISDDEWKRLNDALPKYEGMREVSVEGLEEGAPHRGKGQPYLHEPPLIVSCKACLPPPPPPAPRQG